MAEWLAYGLEQAYAESSEVGVVRKVRPSVGLIDQCKGELRKWLEQGLANLGMQILTVTPDQNMISGYLPVTQVKVSREAAETAA